MTIRSTFAISSWNWNVDLLCCVNWVDKNYNKIYWWTTYFFLVDDKTKRTSMMVTETITIMQYCWQRWDKNVIYNKKNVAKILVCSLTKRGDEMLWHLTFSLLFFPNSHFLFLCCTWHMSYLYCLSMKKPVREENMEGRTKKNVNNMAWDNLTRHLLQSCIP